MNITQSRLDWTPEDSMKWSDFLNTQTGSRLLLKLAEAAPALLATGQTNDILIRSGSLLGFQDAIRTLLELASPVAPPAEEIINYPSLTDDKAWSDNQKIE